MLGILILYIFFSEETLLSKTQILVPMPTKDKDFFEFRDILLESLLLFWPNHELNLMVVLDEEASNIVEFSTRLKSVVPKTVRSFSIATNPPPEFESSGWIRQQQIQMWAGNFTDFEYIAFVDTDTLFVGAVLEESLFKEGKPRVLALYGDPTEPTAPIGTMWATGKKQRFYGMCYFPVVVRAVDLGVIRKTISNHFALSFNEAYDKANNPPSKKWIFVSQFDIMINILYETNHDGYYFQVRPCEHENCEENMHTGRVSTREEAALPEEFDRPFPFVANHWSYESRPVQDSYDFWGYLGHEWTIREVLRYGHCYSLRTFDKKPEYCKKVKLTNLNVFEWRFESRLFINQQGVYDAHLHRRALIETSGKFRWNREILTVINRPDASIFMKIYFPDFVNFEVFGIQLIFLTVVVLISVLLIYFYRAYSLRKKINFKASSPTGCQVL